MPTNKSLTLGNYGKYLYSFPCKNGVLRSLITVKSEKAEAEEAKVEAPAAE